MTLILNIETSTEICSVSLSENNNLLNQKESFDSNSHATQLTVFIEQILSEEKININQLNAIAVSKGPGSYTGLRIGVSTAKGLAYGLNIPLIAINPLQAMVCGIFKNMELKNNFSNTDLFIPMLDDRRMEVYSAVFDNQNKQISETKAEIINSESYKNLLVNNKLYFFGNGADKCLQIIKNENAIFIPQIYTSSKNMIELAYNAFLNHNFVDVAYFEPFYLKDFVATVSTKNIFNT